MKSTVCSPALGWIVAVNNFDGSFKSAWSTTWVQLLQVLNLLSLDIQLLSMSNRHVFCCKKKLKSLNLVKEL